MASTNGFGIERLGAKQKKMLQLMLDNGGRWPWPGRLHMRYPEQQTLQSLLDRGIVKSQSDGAISFYYVVSQDYMGILQEKYGMKVHTQ